VVVKLRSGVLKKISNACIGSYGVVSNGRKQYFSYGKAGVARFMNKRPVVRGIAMNPCDHPHGGGEGRKSQPRLPRTP
jgi:large subunit ribosomal protein L2